MELWAFILGFRFLALGFRFRDFDLIVETLDVGFWTWILQFRSRFLHSPKSTALGLWTLGFGSWPLVYGFCVLGFEPWTFGLWGSGFRSWIVDFTLELFGFWIVHLGFCTLGFGLWFWILGF